MDGHPQHRLRTAVKVGLIGLIVMLGSAGGLFAAQNPKPGIILQAAPASQSVQQGKGAPYTVSVTSIGGFKGAVNLSLAGIPSGATGGFTPASLTLGSGTTATTTLNVTTTAATPVGTSSLTITGTSGKTSGKVTAGLTVNPQVSSTVSVAATPGSVTVPPGATAAYTLQLTRNNFGGPVTFSIQSGLPPGASASFSPSAATGNSSTLQIATTAASRNGSYSLNVVGTGKDAAGTEQHVSAAVQLVVDSTIKQFVLSGDVPGSLSPGTSAGLDLQISNPNNKALSLTNMSVALAGVTRSADAAGRNLSCTAADFTVTQYSGPYPLAIPMGTSSLSGLNIPQAAWPQVGMLDSSANQDGCKGATLQLTYSGSGQGN